MDQLRSLRLDRRLGRRRFVAATLYPEICSSTHPDKDSWLELLLRQFATANRTYKRTYRDRFGQFDRAVARLLAGTPSRPTLRVHDVAVSNGITAVQFYRLLSQTMDRRIDYLASDYSTTVIAVRDKQVTLVFDPVDHAALQLVRLPFVFNLRKKENAKRFPGNWLVRQWLERTRCATLKRRYLEGDPRLKVQQIELLHPECRALVNSPAPFAYRRIDILQPMSGPYDCVRAMNVLNPGYFNVDQIRRALRNIRDSLGVGGLFATGSNQESDSLVHGAVYRKTTKGFERLMKSGNGSPVDALILEE